MRDRYLNTVPASKRAAVASQIHSRSDLLWRQLYAADVAPGLKQDPEAQLKKEARFEFGWYAKGANMTLEETGVDLDAYRCLFDLVTANRSDFEWRMWGIDRYTCGSLVIVVWRRLWLVVRFERAQYGGLWCFSVCPSANACRDWVSEKSDDFTGERARWRPPSRTFDECLPDETALEVRATLVRRGDALLSDYRFSNTVRAKPSTALNPQTSEPWGPPNPALDPSIQVDQAVAPKCSTRMISPLILTPPTCLQPSSCQSTRGYLHYLLGLFFDPTFGDEYTKTDGLVATKTARDWILGNGSLPMLSAVSRYKPHREWLFGHPLPILLAVHEPTEEARQA